ERATASGARTLFGQCVELGNDGVPYAPVAGVLRAMTKEFGTDQVYELAGTGRVALSGLLGDPDPGAGTPDGQPVPGPPDDDGRGRLFDAVTELLERASEQAPLVVVIEDLHWSDRSTLDLLRFATRALVSARVLLVLTYRTEDVVRTHPLRPFLAELERLRSVHRLTIPRLTPTEVGMQVEGIRGSAPDNHALTRIHTRSEGVPFFVEELLGAGETLPDPLRDLLLLRAEHLGEPAQQTVRLLAV